MAEYTEAELNIVRTMAKQGHSARIIAAHLGNRSRNSVVSVIHRRLEKEGVILGEWRKLAAKDRAAAGVKRRHRVVPRPAKSEQMPPAPKPVPQIIDGVRHGAGMPLLMLSRGRCKWPINEPDRGGEYLFCGEAVDNWSETVGGRYCACHRQISKGTKATTQQKAEAMNGFKRAAMVAKKWAA